MPINQDRVRRPFSLRRAIRCVRCRSRRRSNRQRTTLTFRWRKGSREALRMIRLRRARRRGQCWFWLTFKIPPRCHRSSRRQHFRRRPDRFIISKQPPMLNTRCTMTNLRRMRNSRCRRDSSTRSSRGQIRLLWASFCRSVVYFFAGATGMLGAFLSTKVFLLWWYHFFPRARRGRGSYRNRQGKMNRPCSRKTTLRNGAGGVATEGKRCSMT